MINNTVNCKIVYTYTQQSATVYENNETHTNYTKWNCTILLAPIFCNKMAKSVTVRSWCSLIFPPAFICYFQVQTIAHFSFPLQNIRCKLISEHQMLRNISFVNNKLLLLCTLYFPFDSILNLNKWIRKMFVHKIGFFQLLFWMHNPALISFDLIHNLSNVDRPKYAKWYK